MMEFVYEREIKDYAIEIVSLSLFHLYPHQFQQQLEHVWCVSPVLASRGAAVTS